MRTETDRRLRTGIRAAMATLALTTAIALVPGLFTPDSSAAAGPEIDDQGKLRLDRLFGRDRLGGAFVLDVQTTADSSVLVATANYPFRGAGGAAVAKLTPNLEPDPAFGGNGVVDGGELGIGGSQVSSASALKVLGDGRILVAGSIGRRSKQRPQLYVSRLLPDGSLDQAFGDGGVRRIDPTPGRERTRHDALAIQPDGGIVVGFDFRAGGPRRAGLVRLTADGDLDQQFGTDGAVLIPTRVLKPDLALGGWQPQESFDAIVGYDVAADSAGRLALVASVRRRGRNAVEVLRLGAAGQIRDDATTSIGRRRASLHATTVEFDAADRIVVGGGAVKPRRKGPDRSYFAFHRLDGGGEPDRSFGRRGSALLKVGRRDREVGATDLLIDAGGAILAVGSYAGPGGGGVGGSTVVTRIGAGGKADRDFGRRGVFQLPPNRDPGSAIALDPQGRILAAGKKLLTRLR